MKKLEPFYDLAGRSDSPLQRKLLFEQAEIERRISEENFQMQDQSKQEVNPFEEVKKAKTMKNETVPTEASVSLQTSNTIAKQ